MAERVCAVIVTYNRKELLKECLQAVLSQTRPPDHVLVVDNASTDGTAEMVRQAFPQVELLSLAENIGGAGGFHEGIKHAYTKGFDWLWLMDDDAKPEPKVIRVLLSVASAKSLSVVGPLVVDDKDISLLAFTYNKNGTLARFVSQVNKVECIWGQVNLWNGVLMKCEIISLVGLPDTRLFIRGDEVEYFLRLRKFSIPMATSTKCIIRHPGGQKEEFPLLGGRLVAVFTNSDFKNYYLFRNRGYLIRLYGGKLRLARLFLEFARYTWFFWIYRKGDFRGWNFWRKAMFMGYNKKLEPFKEI